MSQAESIAQRHEEIAAAWRGTNETVTVELSQTAAWLLRDLLGLHAISGRIPGQLSLRDDLGRLNDVLGYRDRSRPLSDWSKHAASQLVGRS